MPTNDALIDPRTGVLYGTYTEEEIEESYADTIATAATVNAKEQDILSTQRALLWSIENNPPQKVFRDSMFGALKNKFLQGRLTAEKNRLLVKHRDTGDDKYLVDIQGKLDEIEKLRLEFPDDYEDYGVAQEIISNTGSMAGYLEKMAEGAGPKGVAATAITGGIGYALGGPVGAVEGAKIGAKVGLATGMLAESSEQMGGEIYDSMLRNKTPIDADIRREVSILYGAVSGTTEFAGLGFLLRGAGVAAKVANRIVGIAGEGETEWGQQVIGNIALWDAQRQQAIRSGEEPPELTEDMLFADAKQAARAGLLGATGISAPGAAVSGGKFSADSLRALAKHGWQEKVEKEAGKIIKADKANRIQKKEDSVKAPVPAKDDITKQPREVAPLNEQEIDDMRGEVNVEGTDITDNEVRGLTVDSDPDSNTATIKDFMARAENSTGDKANDFLIELESVLSREEAEAIVDLIQGRADSLGMSFEQYIDYRDLSLRKERGGKDSPSASTTFLPEGDTIIRAFQKADVTSIAHELGHVFRQDIRGKDLSILENWLGIDPGGVWDRTAEEQFARAWERYLAEGKAPTKELKGVFEKFTAWMLNAYKSIKGSLIDVPVTPEVTQVFDNMLVKNRDARVQASRQKQQGMVLEQRQEPRESALKKAENRADENTRIAESLQHRSNMTEQEVVEADLKIKSQRMRDLFDAREQLGYDIAKAEFKATLVRHRKGKELAQKHTALRRKIVSKLRAAQPKTIKGQRVKSKFNYEVQTLLTELFEAFNGLEKRKNAQAVYGDMLLMEPDAVTEVTKLRNKLIQATVEQKPGGLYELQQIYNAINQLVAGGRVTSPYFQNLVRATELMPTLIEEAIGQGVNLGKVTEGGIEQASRRRRKEKGPRERLATMTFGKQLIFGWGGLLEMVSSYSSSEMGRSALYQALDFHSARQQQLTDVRLDFKKIRDGFMDSYGLRTEGGMFSLMNKQNKAIYDIGWGGPWSKSELRTLWLYMQNDRLNDRLYNMGITKDVRDSVDSFMDEADISFAQTLAEHWQSDEEYQRNNEVYKALYGVDMPREYMYIPQRSEQLENKNAQEANERVMSQLQQDRILNLTPESAKATKMRGENTDKVPLKIVGDMSLFNGYTEEMAHFRAFSDVVRRANAILRNKRYRKAIEYEYGARVLQQLMNNLSDNAADGKVNTETVAWADKFRIAFVSSTIGASASVMGKQLISTVNFWQEMPSHLMVKSMMNPAALTRNMKDILSSDFAANRKGHIDRDIKNAMASGEYTRMMLNPSAKNIMMFNIRLGDMAAIALGGTVYMQYLMKEKGYTRAEAILEVGAKANRTQQAGTTEELSSGQRRGGSLAKFFTMYSTGPVQAIRQELEAIRGVAGGRMSPAKFAKTMFIYHILVPVLYSAAASMISGEDEEEAIGNAQIAMMLGPLGSAYSAGRVLTNGFKYAMGRKSYTDTGPFPDTVHDITKVARYMIANDLESLTVDDWVTAFQAGAVLSGRGAPIQRMGRQVTGAVEGDIPGAVFGLNPERDR